MKEKVYNYFKEIGIEFENYDHPPLYTCADNDKYDLKFDGILCKNLFLRNKNKSKYYLISMPIDKKANLSDLMSKLDEKKLCFASEDDLFLKLNIKSGAVSILNINNTDKTDVIFIVDETLLHIEKVGFHPNNNTSTIFFNGKYLENLLQYFEVTYKFINL